MVAGLLPALPFLLIPGAFVLLSLLATRGLLFTGSKLSLKASRINPIENAKNKFGRRGLFEFFKSFLKLSVYSILLALFLRGQLDVIVGSAMGAAGRDGDAHGDLMKQFLFIVVLIAAVIGGARSVLAAGGTHPQEPHDPQGTARRDEGIRRRPALKHHRRMRGQELALNQMMADVPKADVVIVNPTHFAVALSWSRLPGSAPVCVAKGQDAVAARIRKAAQEAGVPIHSDPPTARALYATTKIGAEIAADHYRPVAAAIRFAEKMRRKAKERGW